MKKITRIRFDLYHVFSEPGDATRYSYFVHRDGPDEFCFMPGCSPFRFPQRIDYYSIVDCTEEELLIMKKKENCNLWTLKECIRTIKELKAGGK